MLDIPHPFDLGKRHVAYGVTDKNYGSVGTAVLWTLEQGLGADLTEPVKTAWTEAYATLAGVMKSRRCDDVAAGSRIGFFCLRRAVLRKAPVHWPASPAMKNECCRMHGGKVLGGPKGNRNAWKFGNY